MYAEVVKLADALDSKSSDSDIVPVRFRSSAPRGFRRFLVYGAFFILYNSAIINTDIRKVFIT